MHWQIHNLLSELVTQNIYWGVSFLQKWFQIQPTSPFTTGDPGHSSSLKPLLSRNIYEMKFHSTRCQRARLIWILQFPPQFINEKISISPTYPACIGSLLPIYVFSFLRGLNMCHSITSFVENFLNTWFCFMLILNLSGTISFSVYRTAHRKWMRFNRGDIVGLAILIN